MFAYFDVIKCTYCYLLTDPIKTTQGYKNLKEEK